MSEQREKFDPSTGPLSSKELALVMQAVVKGAAPQGQLPADVLFADILAHIEGACQWYRGLRRFAEMFEAFRRGEVAIAWESDPPARGKHPNNPPPAKRLVLYRLTKGERLTVG